MYDIALLLQIWVTSTCFILQLAEDAVAECSGEGQKQLVRHSVDRSIWGLATSRINVSLHLNRYSLEKKNSIKSILALAYIITPSGILSQHVAVEPCKEQNITSKYILSRCIVLLLHTTVFEYFHHSLFGRQLIISLQFPLVNNFIALAYHWSLLQEVSPLPCCHGSLQGTKLP